MWLLEAINDSPYVRTMPMQTTWTMGAGAGKQLCAKITGQVNVYDYGSFWLSLDLEFDVCLWSGIFVLYEVIMFTKRRGTQS